MVKTVFHCRGHKFDPWRTKIRRLRGAATKKKKKKDKPTPSPFAVVVKANGFSSNPLHFHRNISDNRKKKVVSADVYSGNKNRPGRELELMPV